VSGEADQLIASCWIRRAACLGSVAAAAVVACAAAPDAGARANRAPIWDVGGRWDGFNGAEYLILRQGRRGRLDITVHHTCAPGQIERGHGRIRGAHVTGRVRPLAPPPPGCARFAVIDVRVEPDGRSMRGRYRTDRASGLLLYLGRSQARSLVGFRPVIRQRGRRLQVLLRPSPSLPRGATARVTLCTGAACTTRSGRWGPLFERRGGCLAYRATVEFAGARASARRRLCS
jgi:hypothetical protein